MSVEPGQWRHVLSIQEATLSTDSFRQDVPTWNTVTTWRGFVRPLTAREAIQAGQLQSSITHKVFTWWSNIYALKATNRIVFEGRVLNILGVRRPDERPWEWEIDAQEIPGDPTTG